MLPASLVPPVDNRLVAFDSNILTYFLAGNNGNFEWSENNALTAEHVAAVRLFLHCEPVIAPTVMAEAQRIPDRQRAQEHLGFIRNQFIEILPDGEGQAWIATRAEALRRVHDDQDDCRLVAEVEWDGSCQVLVTNDQELRRLAPHTRQLRLETADAYWRSLDIPRGTPPRREPAPGHPLFEQTWWRW